MPTETKATHTPGPWELEHPPDDSNSSIYGPDGKLVVAGEYDGYMTPFGCRGEDEGGANARLCAAAPELLALARRVAEHFADTDAPLGMAARAAIAKATE